MSQGQPPDLASEENKIPSPEQLGAWVAVSRAGALDPEAQFGPALRAQQTVDRSKEQIFRELPSHIDPVALSQTGWGVIYPVGRNCSGERNGR